MAGTNWLARERSRPESCARRQRYLEKVSLVVADRVTGLHQGFAVIAHQDGIAGLFDNGHQDCLLRISRHIYGKRSRSVDIAGPQPKGSQRRRLAAGYHLAQVGCVGAFQPLRFHVFDLSRSQHLHRHSTGFTLGLQETQEGNPDLTFARGAGFTRDDKPGGLLNRFQKLNRQLSVLDLPIGHHCPQHLVDGDLIRKLNSYFGGRALGDFNIDFCIEGC